ncbi:FAD-binding oxidoreductase [Kineosporia succinea]|uniref:FAD/FMN-containing dehydrogenase n=1 Tax=Kineosporia succinea TaxID=84632 RepID=A0ABT9PC87_9ACTN|nr:FAD-binding oxidoreductase [Kineosporia succinea]MDP9829610.1 FAD/FMN-containing dehydrogenase [Kineosporia succinea]
MNDTTVINPTDVKLLASRTTGPVATPADEQYEALTSSWNLAYPQSPAVVVGAADADDVQAAVRFAAAADLPVAVLSTGHGTWGSTEQAVLINVRALDSVTIDPLARTATVGAGVEWQDVVSAAGVAGLAPVSGSALNVGVVGYTLGGGLSPVLGRAYGWAADHVLAFDIVTPDGQLRTVDPQSEPDLFWAVRGGKSAFGVVTSLTFSLMPVPRFFGGGLYVDAVHAEALLAEFRHLTALDDDRLTVSFAFLRMPAAPFVPEPLRGRVCAHLRFSFLGNAVEGQELVAPARALAPALIDTVCERPYTEYAAVHDDPVAPMPAYERTRLLAEFPEEAATALIEAAGAGVDTPVLVVEIRQLGGALSREPRFPSAVSHRDVAFSFWVGTVGAPGRSGAASPPLESLIDALKAWQHTGSALNFLGTTDPAATAEAYSPQTLDRLRQLKREFDPGNLFRVNHNLVPTTQER